jgi:hypothetical protein
MAIRQRQVLRFIRRHLHLASARDSAMVAGSVAQLWQARDGDI